MYLDPDLLAESYPDKRALNRNTVLNSVLPPVSGCIFCTVIAKEIVITYNKYFKVFILFVVLILRVRRIQVGKLYYTLKQYR